MLSFIGEHGIGLPAWRPARDPGRVTAEMVVTGAALGLDPAAKATLVGAAAKP